ncbi:hypothetical protein BS78_03G382600 [Paspalum vaginatum]|nr:hypothetical protein BS78_03G382600 [Paspalum vaginatum]
MAAVFFHHVVGDLTVGKPEVAELLDTGTLDDAARAIAASPEGVVPVWRPRATPDEPPSGARFIGMISALDIAAFVAAAGVGDRAMRAMVGEVVHPNPGLLREIDPGTRLIDALELMRHGVKRFLVRKSGSWRGITKRFSVLYNGKWLKNMESTSPSAASSRQQSSSSGSADKFCCLSREDVLRFLIGCLGALAPIPLTQISSLGAINPQYIYVEASAPAMEAVQKIPQDPCAVAVVETTPDGARKILGDISAYKLWKCDYVSAAWALANLSAGQFVIGADENGSTPILALPEPPISPSSPVDEIGPGRSPRAKKFSSRSIGFLSNSQANQMSAWRTRSAYHRGRSTPLTCKSTSTLAAVMAQMLSHRATHVWVTDAESSEDGDLFGVVGYTEIFNAAIRSTCPSPTTS